MSSATKGNDDMSGAVSPASAVCSAEGVPTPFPAAPITAVPGSLRRQVGVGILWVAIATICSRGFALLRKLLLARLLVPDDFGLVAYASLTIGVLELARELGFGAALIYRKDDIEEAANTTFVAILAASALLYAVAWFAAPGVARFFHPQYSGAGRDPLVSVIRVLSFTMVLSAISQVPLTLMAKGMGFRNKVVPEMIAVLTGSIISVVLAFTGYGVWSIVYGQIIISAVLAILVWFIPTRLPSGERVAPWRPTFRFDLRVAKELWDYGKHIISSQVMIFFITNLDDAFVGRLLGDAALGFYSLAYELSNLPATHLSRIVGQVMFPAFSQVQNQPNRRKQVFFTSMKYVSLVAFPIAIITLVYAETFIIFAYGLKWFPAVVPLQLLTVYGLARAIAVNMGNVFKAGGKPKWLFYIATWRLVTMAAFLYPAIKFRGVTGVAGLSALVAVLDFALSMYLANRIIQARWGRWASTLLPMLLTAVVTALIGHRLYLAIEHTVHPFVSMPVTGGLALFLHLSLMWLIDPDVRLVASQVVAGVLRELGRRPGDVGGLVDHEPA